VRCIAFVAGGFLPPALSGSVNHANIHVADWYATLCGLYGIDARDRRSAAAGGVPPIDSLDAWATILTVNATTATGRQELAIDVNGNNVRRTPGVSLTILDRENDTRAEYSAEHASSALHRAASSPTAPRVAAAR
jgi:hypothetical protein